MLSSKIYRTGSLGALPAYNENRLRARSGLDANRVEDFDALVEAAIKAFTDETELRVRQSAYAAEFDGGELTYRAGGLLSRLTVPGLNAEVTAVMHNGTAVDPAKWTTWADDSNGSMHVEPVNGMQWDITPLGRLLVEFTAGVAAVPSDIQEILGVRIRYDYYAEEGDGIAFIHRCEPYNYLRSRR